MDTSRFSVMHLRPLRYIAIGTVLCVSACAVGPDFVRPKPPDVLAYTSPRSPAVLGSSAGETSQHVSLGEAVEADWWSLFRSLPLNQTIEQALAGNQTLAAAQATLAESQQVIIEARGSFFPQLDFAASAQRQRVSASRTTGGSTLLNVGSQTYNLYSLGPSVSYAPDVFGGTRRRVEQARALAENQNYQLAAAYLTLTGNVVTQAITIASVRLQLSAANDVIADDEKNLALIQRKFQAGKAAQSEVISAQSQLASDRALLPPLGQQLSTARHALTILVGKFPGQWSPPDFELSEFTLPNDLPLSLPSQLVRQRPDILAAEAQLHASSAAIGIATSQMFPSITLSGSFGVESLSTGSLFNSSSETSSLLAGVTAPLFHGRALEAQKKAAIETFRASLATYRQTVLQAFGQVADTLRSLDFDSQLVAAERSALDAAQMSLKLQRLSYAAGKSDVLQLLDAERSYQQAQLGFARAQAQRYQDTVLLLVAMGGGWQSRQGRCPLQSTCGPIDSNYPTKK